MLFQDPSITIYQAFMPKPGFWGSAMGEFKFGTCQKAGTLKSCFGEASRCSGATRLSATKHDIHWVKKFFTLSLMAVRHEGAESICWSPDGTRLAAAKGEGIDIWDLTSRKPTTAMKNLKGVLSSCGKKTQIRSMC